MTNSTDRRRMGSEAGLLPDQNLDLSRVPNPDPGLHPDPTEEAEVPLLKGVDLGLLHIPSLRPGLALDQDLPLATGMIKGNIVVLRYVLVATLRCVNVGPRHVSPDMYTCFLYFFVLSVSFS